MLNRVTTQTTAAAAQRGMQANAAKLAQLQQGAQDLKKISRPSDDPAGTADSMAVRAAQAAAVQYGRNIGNGDDWMTVADSALANATTLLQKVKDATIQGANGAINQAAKNAIATELDSLKADLLNQANARFTGRNIFAGNSDAAGAFIDTPTAFTFTGAAGSSVQRRISPDATIRVDADGAAIFGDAATSVFALITKIADDLRSGTDVSTHLDSVDAALDKVIGGRAEVGARHAELLRAKDANANAVVDLENQRSGIEDLDIGKAILDLKTQELAYQASLGVTAKVLQPTLMDFLR
ncbi:flagellar hook-associated protein FlgL [Specibacter sp. RAF43]|uniref:flagellar hook-associated protein FlgL n=1 Tax=Specibacter sp. RAF43 TaxID=3233057 RepID=UPI003F947003